MPSRVSRPNMGVGRTVYKGEVKTGVIAWF